MHLIYIITVHLIYIITSILINYLLIGIIANLDEIF